MPKKRFRKTFLFIIIVILLGAGGYFVLVKKVVPISKTIIIKKEEYFPGIPEDKTRDLQSYVYEEYGFEFKFSKKWWTAGYNPLFINFESPGSMFDGGNLTFDRVFISIYDTTKDYNAKKEVEKIQKIIDERYVRPADDPPTDMDYYYRKEFYRYFINNFKNINGIDIYHYNYFDRNSIVERQFYFDTKKNKTVHMKVYSLTTCVEDCGKETEENRFFSDFPEFKIFFESIKIL